MTHSRRELVAMLVVVFACWTEAALAQPFPGGLPQCLDDVKACQADLNACDTSLGTCTSNVTLLTDQLGSCTTTLTTCQTDLEGRTTELSACQVNLGTCEGKLGTCETELSACQATPATAGHFPASGQTTCWDTSGAAVPCAGTGQDGDVRAGATLSYTDNGDGTITDNNTKLVWEKKSMDGSIHDVGALYSWDEAFMLHIQSLNAANFAGHNDWRLPNVRELLSIVDYGALNPPVSSAFNNNCNTGATVLTGSCTKVANYWTSTTLVSAPDNAWAVHFGDGLPGGLGKIGFRRVRAVRGGL